MFIAFLRLVKIAFEFAGNQTESNESYKRLLCICSIDIDLCRILWQRRLVNFMYNK